MTVTHKLARWLCRLLAVIGFLTVLIVATPLVSWWARAYSGPIEQPKGDVLILLSAASDDAVGISYSSYWRSRMAVLAWRNGGFKTIVISGASGPGICDFLMAQGIPRDAIVADWQSTSTRESGINTARLIEGLPGRKILLTSDFHMFRAIRVFRRLGIQLTPMVAPDVLHTAEHWSGRFPAFEKMAVESAKIAYYSFRGWM